MLLEDEGKVTRLSVRDHLAFRRRSLTIHRGSRQLVFSSDYGMVKRPLLELPLLKEPTPPEMKEIVRLLTRTRRLDVKMRSLSLFMVTERNFLQTTVFTYGQEAVMLQEYDHVLMERDSWELQFLRNDEPLVIVDPNRRGMAFNSIQLPFSHGTPMHLDTARVIAELTGAVNGLDVDPIPQPLDFLSRFVFHQPRSRTPAGGIRQQIV